MGELQKVYRVKCKTSYINKEGYEKVFKQKTDFINQFPTHDEIELCLKKHNDEVDSVMNIMYRKLNTEVVITEFQKYIQTTLEILGSSKSLYNEYASLHPDAKTITSDEQKIIDEEKRINREIQ